MRMYFAFVAILSCGFKTCILTSCYRVTSDITCKENQEYLLCGPAADPSCADLLNMTSGIDVPEGACQEGCFCKEGSRMDQNECVPEDQCGCDYNGVYLSVSHVFALGIGTNTKFVFKYSFSIFEYIRIFNVCPHVASITCLQTLYEK